MDFARELGVGQSTLSGIEKGRQAPTVKLIADVAALVGCDLNWLILGVGAEPVNFPVGPLRARGRPVATEVWRERDEVDRDPALYRQWVPIIGYYAPEGLVDHPERGENETLDPYLSFGPAPRGSVAARLLVPVANFERDDFLVFAAPEKVGGAAGFALVRVRGKPEYIITAWERTPAGLHAFAEGVAIETIPRDVLKEVRPFFARM